MILDSGNRKIFSSGAVRDIHDEKGRCDLLPLDVVAELLNDSVFRFIDNFTKDGDVSWLYEALANTMPQFGNYSTMFLEVSKHFEEGAKKYSENNWRLGINAKNYIDSAVRHRLKWLRGDDDEPHDRAFVWNILCCTWTCQHMPELNDYRKEEKKRDKT